MLDGRRHYAELDGQALWSRSTDRGVQLLPVACERPCLGLCVNLARTPLLEPRAAGNSLSTLEKIREEYAGRCDVRSRT